MIIASRAVLITCAALLFAQPVHAEVALAAHRAVYDLGLLKSSGAKAPIHAHGRIVLEFSGSACEGYVQNFRQITDMQPPEGASKLSDMTAATFESGDGESFRFKTQTRIERAIIENVDGRARKQNGGVEVSVEKPKKAAVNIAAPTFFPTEHLRRILSAAQAGDKFLEARVFDGSGEGDKAFDTLTVIGAPLTTAAPEKAAQEPGVGGLKRWPVSVSYFEAGKRDGQPVYVLSFDLYENGVSRALRLDYGDFVLGGELEALSFLKVSPCDHSGKP